MSETKNPSSYEEAYRNLYNAYRERLKNSLEAIDNILAQRQLKPLAKADLLRAQHMAHSLAGSGSTFGFPEVTVTGQKADSSLDKIIKSMAPDGSLDDSEFEEVQKLLMALRGACEAAFQKADEKEPFSAPRDVSRKPENSSHILVIDDDQHLGELLSMKLQQKSLRVTVARNGDAAMTVIRNGIPDLIILDISMPGMSGHEVLRKVKQDPEFVGIPILMLTGQADQKDVVSALHSGAMDYILKPFDPEKLIARIEKILDAMRYTVLVADNDPLILQLLDSKLRHAGFKVVLLDDGRKAWDRIQKSIPDLVILDRMMPGMEGVEVVRKMRQENATKDIPAIIISACRERHDIESGLKAGAQKYIVKPFLSDDLIAESRRLLKKSGIRKRA